MRLFVELTLNFHNHLHGGKSNGLHRHGRKGEWNHSSNDQKGKSQGFKHVNSICEENASRSFTDSCDKGSKESKRYECGRSNGESLSDGSCRVSGSIKSISLLTYIRLELSHLSNSSCIITDGAIHINSQTSCQVGKETNGSQGDSVHITKSE